MKVDYLAAVMVVMLVDWMVYVWVGLMVALLVSVKAEMLAAWKVVYLVDKLELEMVEKKVA